MEEEKLNLKKVKKLKNFKNKLNLQLNKIKKKISKQNKNILKKKKKIIKIEKKLQILCMHNWEPDFLNYNIYDTPKKCNKCGLFKK